MTALVVAFVSVPGYLGAAFDFVTGQRGPTPQPVSKPGDDPMRGMVYAGLTPGKKGQRCVGQFAVSGTSLCSHGPDQPPAGLDVRRAVTPVATGLATPVLPRRDTARPDESDVVRDTGATRPVRHDAPAVVEAAAAVTVGPVTVGPNGVVCDGDGRTGKRVQVVYIHEAGQASRFAQFLPSFRTWAAGVDTIYDASAAETGGSRHIRYVTTPDCNVDVAEVEVPAGQLATFSRTISALRTLGFNRTDRKYMIFAESRVYCGIGTFAGDTSPGSANRSNFGPSYGRSDSGCWTAGVAAHELGHNLGAVNNNSPNTSGAAHCLDEFDVMCYADSSGRPTRSVCADRAHNNRLDCNHDDYFHTSPRAGSYLATNWNMADNDFLIRGDGGGGPTPTPTPTAGSPTPTRSPTGQPSPTRSPTGQPSPTRSPTASPTRSLTRSPTTSPTRSPTASPSPTPTGSLRPLRVTGTTTNSTRLSWDPAADGAQYAILLDGANVGVVDVTSVVLVGLKPDTAYRVQVAIQGGDGGLKAYTQEVAVRTSAANTPPEGQWVSLANALTGGMADVYASRTADGVPVILYQAHSRANQLWQLDGTAGTTLVRSKVSGKCLAPLGGMVAAGVPLVQYACDATSAAQQWGLVRTPYGFALTTRSGLVVGVSRLRFGGHRLLVLQQASGARYQSWTTQPV